MCDHCSPECLPALALGGPGRQHAQDTYAIAPAEVGVALVVEAIDQARNSMLGAISGLEWKPGLVLGRHRGQEGPDIPLDLAVG